MYALMTSSITAHLFSTLIILSYFSGAIQAAVPQSAGWAGKIAGVRVWQLPTTPNPWLTRPTQVWHCVSSGPNGDIYLNGMDHATNAAMYRMTCSDSTLRYLGDGKTAAIAVNNLRANETFQKFHTRPIHYKGKMYVASMNNSDLNTTYQSERGFHFFAYDTALNTFSDLSVSDSNGIGGKSGGLVSIVVDTTRKFIYGDGQPVADLFRYNLTTGRTDSLGRPSQYNIPYIYGPRFIWMDSRGRVYLVNGMPNYYSSYYYRNESAAVFGHVYYWDPTTGFGQNSSWTTQIDAIEAGQWTRDRKHLYVTGVDANLYRFDDEGPAWTFIGKMGNMSTRLWTLYLSADDQKIYFAESERKSNSNTNYNRIFEYTIATKQTTQICDMSELDDQVKNASQATGFDSWDADGNFYYSSFYQGSQTNAFMTRINPVRLKYTKGLLANLVSVTAVQTTGTQNSVTFRRTGGANTVALDVLYDAVTTTAGGTSIKKNTISIPANQSEVVLSVAQFQTTGWSSVSVTVVPDGNDYLAGAQRAVVFSASSRIKSAREVSGQQRVVMQGQFSKEGLTAIKVTLPAHSAAGQGYQLTIHDIFGRAVASLPSRILSSGVSIIPFNISNKNISADQVYFVRLLTEGNVVAKASVIREFR